MQVQANGADYAISTYALFELPLREAVDQLVADGWTSIELMCEGNHAEILEWTQEQVSTLAEWGREKGVRWSLHAPISRCNPAAEEQAQRDHSVELMRRCLHLVGELQCSHVVMHVGQIRDHLDPVCRDQGVRRVIHFLQQLLADSDRTEISLALENVPPYPGVLGWNVDDLVSICQGMDDSRVGIVYDVGHAHLIRPGYVLESLRQVLPHLLALHLSDNRGEHDDHLAVGEGAIPFPQVVSFLCEQGYRGFWTLETTSVADARLSIDRLGRYRENEGRG
ncbi:sugar phosphate isomerase/epimerase [Brevibacillus humidisoli]|uniref:sugar phosphate isomerase/epimerase family protein n=1 Tax=Brevibacillus humidisoli TaxID=2895522 RepID=UPI001E2ED4D6|nr:sugar phosphate isomerase/epimerase family protein [Brevibacillus humidisoli]UFJ40273.1 sugar phosphate isomerase/epimerase [Brevibacillus humidisoli]